MLSFFSSGSKKVQQELSKPGMVERYLTAEKAAKVRQTFAILHSMTEVSYNIIVCVVSHDVNNAS